MVLFFFFKRKPAYDMRISDWISDVCSSDLLDREAAARQTSEILRGLAVEPLRDPRRAIEQFLRRLRIELRVGAQEVQKSGEIALEPDLVHDGRHSGANLLHFRKAACVYLVGRRVGGGELGDLRLIIRSEARGGG